MSSKVPRRTKSASEIKVLTPNVEWQCPTKETKSSLQRREMNAGKGVRSQKAGASEGPKQNDWLRKKHVEQKQEIQDLRADMEVLRKVDNEKVIKLKGYEDKIKLLEETNQTLDEQIIVFTKAKFELTHKFTETKETNDSLLASLKLKEDENIDLLNNRIKLQREIEALTRETNLTRNQFNEKLAEVINEKLLLEEYINGELKCDLNDLCCTLKEERDKNQQMKMENENLLNENALQEKNILRLQKNENSLNDKIKEYLIIDNELEKSKINEKKLIQNNEGLTKEIEVLTARNEEVDNEMKDLQCYVSQLEVAKRKLINESNLKNEVIKETKTSYDGVITNLNRDKEDSIKELHNKDEVIEAKIREINELTTKLKHDKELMNKAHLQWNEEREINGKTIVELKEINLCLANEFKSIKQQLDAQTKSSEQIKSEKLHNEHNFNQEIETLNGCVERVTSQLNKSIEEHELMKLNALKHQDELECLKNYAQLKDENIIQNEELIIQMKCKLDMAYTSIHENQKSSGDKDKTNFALKETNKQLENSIKECNERNCSLEKSNAHVNQQLKDLREKFDGSMKENEITLAEVKGDHLKTKEKLYDEIDLAKIKYRQENDELMKNFSELESELNFCQDELVTKSNEVTQLRNELSITTTEYKLQQKKLSKKLVSFNEQNETILQNEISKCKSEYNEKILEFREQNNKNIEAVHNDFQIKFNTLKDQYQANKLNELERMRNVYENKLQVVERENNLLTKNAKKVEKEIEACDVIIKSKKEEVDKNGALIRTLSKRIETQQKLVDYVMRTLERERNTKDKNNDDILNILTDIHGKINESKSFASNPMRRSISHSSLLSNVTHSEMEFSTRSSPLHSPQKDEGFRPMLTSSPMSTKFSWSLPLFNYNKKDDVLKPGDTSLLAKTAPESDFQDLGYCSPTASKSYHSVYFEDQIKNICNTFRNIEAISVTSENELSLEVWKKKIHFRLMVLEKQMTQFETSNCSNALDQSNLPTCSTTTWQTFQKQKLKQPSNEQIQALIENVNEKYKFLNKMKLFKHFEE